MSRKILELAREQQDEMDALLEADSEIPAEADDDEGSVLYSMLFHTPGAGPLADIRILTCCLEMTGRRSTDHHGGKALARTTRRATTTTTSLDRTSRRRSTRSWSVEYSLGDRL